jgi:hypothetical protein
MILKRLYCTKVEYSTRHVDDDGEDLLATNHILPNGEIYFNDECEGNDFITTFYPRDERKRYYHFSSGETEKDMMSRYKDGNVKIVDTFEPSLTSCIPIRYEEEYEKMYHYLKTMTTEMLSQSRFYIDAHQKKILYLYGLLNIKDVEINEETLSYDLKNSDIFQNYKKIYCYMKKLDIKDVDDKDVLGCDIDKEFPVKKNKNVEMLLADVTSYIKKDRSSLFSTKIRIIEKIKKCGKKLKNMVNVLPRILCELNRISVRSNYFIHTHAPSNTISNYMYSTFNVYYLFSTERNIRTLTNDEKDAINYSSASCDGNFAMYNSKTNLIKIDLYIGYDMISSFHIPGVKKVDRISLMQGERVVYTVKNTNVIKFEIFPIITDIDVDEMFNIVYTISETDRATIKTCEDTIRPLCKSELAKRDILKKYRPVVRYSVLGYFFNYFKDTTHMCLTIKDEKKPLNSIYIRNDNTIIKLRDMISNTSSPDQHKIYVTYGEHHTQIHQLQKMYVPLDNLHIPKIILVTRII